MGDREADEKRYGPLDVVAIPAMGCEECGHVETEDLFLDTETCSKCGGMLAAFDTDD